MTAPPLLIVGPGTHSDAGVAEASGAALAVPLVQAARRVPRDVAALESAGLPGAKE